jgi:hypothetical protein
MYGNSSVPIFATKDTMTQVLSPTNSDAATSRSSAATVQRAEMSTLSMPVFVIIAFGTMIVGVAIGALTGNGLFIYEMVGLPVAAIFAFAAFATSGPRTRPDVGTTSVALPLVALVVACVGSPALGIALGHASRYLIASRGGEGEKIALAALIVSYSILAVIVIAVLWIATILRALL